MLSFGLAIYTWAAESASTLFDLANAGRAADNGFVLAIAAGLAIVRLMGLLLFTLPPAWWLYERLRKRDTRGLLIVVVVASILFELWVSPTRLTQTQPDNSGSSAVTEAAEGAGNP